ncbi:helix-turn-helix domain-containing protein, partial [Actinacidiphila soli]|uniref:helix-turn-helix domain-containing protein n=1 Tax=Actinacidiphila soli TaxID=2487275 RepID=UPI000FCA6F8C
AAQAEPTGRSSYLHAPQRLIIHDLDRLSQHALARRAGVTQPGISRIELGGTTPALPLLSRLTRAMESDLDIHLAPERGEIVVRFTPRRTQEAA